MAKYYNNKVKTGKLAGSVFAVRYGEVIERAYQPVVSNPSTPKQVESRAKLKLMSQLASVMADVIAMPREGSISSRNLFIRANYLATSYVDDVANVELGAIMLTRSVVSLPPVRATRVTGTGDIDVSLFSAASADISRVVYAVFTKQEDGTLRYVGSTVSDTVEGNFPATVATGVQTETLVYAYGVRDNTGRAKVIFGDMVALSAETVAKLIVTRTLTDADITLTETRSARIVAA